MYRDREPHLKRSKQCYEAFCLSHIPQINVNIDITATTERLSVFMPSDVVEKLPGLAKFTRYSRDGWSYRASAVRAALRLPLPGRAWSLLAVLKLLLETTVDTDSLMLCSG